MIAETFKQHLKTKRKQKEAAKTPQIAQTDETESDSDYDQMNLVPKMNHGKRVQSGFTKEGRRHRVRQSNYLEEHLTIQNLAGLVPQSLLVNVDFEKFARENQFEPVD